MTDKIQEQKGIDFSGCYQTEIIRKVHANEAEILRKLREFTETHKKTLIYSFEEDERTVLLRYISQGAVLENLYGLKYKKERPDVHVQVFTPRDIDRFTSFTNRLYLDPDEESMQGEIEGYSPEWKRYESEEEIRRVAAGNIKRREMQAFLEKSIRHFDLGFCENGIIPYYENPFDNSNIQMYAPLVTIYDPNTGDPNKVKMVGKDEEIQNLINRL